MANWTFPIDAQGWSEVDGLVWIDTEGSPGLGCMGAAAHAEVGNSTITGLNIPVVEGDPYSFRVKIISEDDDFDEVTINMDFNEQEGASEVVVIPSVPFDSGWFVINSTITELQALSSPITEITVGFTATGSTIVKAFIDSIFMAEAPEEGAILYYGHGNLTNQQGISV